MKDADPKPLAPEAGADAAAAPKPCKPISMHEDVPVWADCCSCEAEPYWTELAEESDASEVPEKPKARS